MGGIVVGVDGPKLPERPGLVAALMVLPSQVQGAVGVLPRLVGASGQETDLTEPRHVLGMRVQRTRADIVPERLFQESEAFRELSQEGVRLPQTGGDLAYPVAVITGTADRQALAEHPHGLLQVTLGEIE